MHWEVFAFARAIFSAGSSIEARIAMIAITTSNSIKVNFFLRIIALRPIIVNK